VSRVIDRLRCRKQQHVLATLTVDDGALVAETREAAATPYGMATIVRQYGEADIAERLSLIVVVACGCGVPFQVDVAAFMRRDPVTLVRVEPESTSGVSYDRRRH
jgi:hypothetical protein